MVDGATKKIYLVDWGSAAEECNTDVTIKGTVHYSAARILDKLMNSQAVTFTSADDLESLICSAFCLCHPALQAQLQTISKSDVCQIQEWWLHTAFTQRYCWQEAVEVARRNDYKEVALRLQRLMQ